MKTLLHPQTVLLGLLVAVVTSAEGCRAIEVIFKAGFWVGIVIAVVAVAVIFGLVRTLSS